jgi:hypothetical protein
VSQESDSFTPYFILRIPQHQDRNAQKQNGRDDHQDAHIAHVDDGDAGQHAGKNRDGDEYQELDGNPAALEIDADHGAEFQVDEQQQDVRYGTVGLIHHAEIGIDRRPHDGPA